MLEDETLIKLAEAYIAIEDSVKTIVAFDEVNPENDPAADIPQIEETTTTAKVTTTQKPTDTEAPSNDETTAKTETTTKAPVTTGANTNENSGGCAGFSLVGAFAAIVVLVGNIAFIKAKKY